MSSARGLRAVADREIALAGRAGSTPPRPTWRATSRRFWAAAPTSTAPCSDPRRSRRCSSPTTSLIRAYRAWGWGSSVTRWADTAPWATTASGRASAPTWCSLRMQGIGVLAFANTGWFDPRGAPVPVANAVLRSLLDLPDDAVRTDAPEHPEIWSDLCGWYSLGPGVLTDPQPRAMLGAGVEVVVRRRQLTIRGQMPIPAVRKGLRLHPDGDDPYAFRIDLFGVGGGHVSRRVQPRTRPRGDGSAPRPHSDALPEAARPSEPEAVGQRRARRRRSRVRRPRAPRTSGEFARRDGRRALVERGLRGQRDRAAGRSVARADSSPSSRRSRSTAAGDGVSGLSSEGSSCPVSQASTIRTCSSGARASQP